MDTKKLRQKILDLAIRGKLVPQDPNDEPASVLLERIRAEKERLIAEGKIKRPKKSKTTSPARHYQKFTPPFEIPDSWEWSTLGEVFSMQAGKNIQATKLRSLSSTTPYPCFGGNGIRGFLSQYSHNGIYPIIGRQGALCGNINIAKGKFYATEHAVVVNYFANTNVLLWGLFLENLNLNQFATATAQPGLSVAKIEEVPIPVPPVQEQNRIVEAVQNWMMHVNELVESTVHLSGLISSAKSKILDLAMQGKLVPQDPADEPAADMLCRINPKAKIITDNQHSWNIPNSWTWCQLGDIFQHNTGKALNASNNEGIEYEYITTSNVYWNKFELGALKKMPFKESEIDKCIIQRGDLLVCEGGDVGRAAIWNLNRSVMIQNHLHRLRPIANEIITSLYFRVFRLYKDKDLIGGKGIALQGFSSKSLHQLVVPLPPLNEQKRIVAKIDELYSVLDEIETSLQS